MTTVDIAGLRGLYEAYIRAEAMKPQTGAEAIEAYGGRINAYYPLVAAMLAALPALLDRLEAAERDAGQWERINRVATNIRANLESLPSIASTWVEDLESAMQEPQP